MDARDESNSSWMRFIRCARQRFEQNMVVFQYHGCIYYRTTRDVKVGEELLVWYDSRYSLIFGIPVALNETGSRGNIFQVIISETKYNHICGVTLSPH